MLPYRVSNPGPLTYESGALPIALRGPAIFGVTGKRTECYCHQTLGQKFKTFTSSCICCISKENQLLQQCMVSTV